MARVRTGRPAAEEPFRGCRPDPGPRGPDDRLRAGGVRPAARRRAREGDDPREGEPGEALRLPGVARPGLGPLFQPGGALTEQSFLAQLDDLSERRRTIRPLSHDNLTCLALRCTACT